MTSTHVHGAMHLHTLTLIKRTTPNPTTMATEKVFHGLFMIQVPSEHRQLMATVLEPLGHIHHCKNRKCPVLQ